MKKTFSLLIATGFLILAAVPQAQAQAVPPYKVDPSWPKELPNNWNACGDQHVEFEFVSGRLDLH